jgi:hypothetical protein
MQTNTAGFFSIISLSTTLYHAEALYLPEHPVTVAMVIAAIKKTLYINTVLK